MRLQRKQSTQRAHGAPERSVSISAPRVSVIHPLGTHPDGEESGRLRSAEQGSLLGERRLLHNLRKDKVLPVQLLRGGGLHQQIE